MFDPAAFSSMAFYIVADIEVTCSVQVAPKIRVTIVAEDVALGTLATLTASFTDEAGDPYAAANVRFTLRRPAGWNGEVEEIGTETGEDLDNPDPGVFAFETLLRYPGIYRFRFECLDTGNEAAAEGSFAVRRPLEP